MKIKLPNQTLNLNYGAVLGAKGKDMQMTVFGESSFEEMNNLFFSALKHLYESAVMAHGEESREEIYTRAVQMFSLMIDDFYPEGKDKKYGILTDEDIKKAEDSKIKNLARAKHTD